MEAYIVITAADVLTVPLERLLIGSTVYTSGEGRRVVERGASHVFIVQEQSLREDFLDEPAVPPAARDVSNFYVLEFNDPLLVREVVTVLASRITGWVDDDHGRIVPLEQWNA